MIRYDSKERLGVNAVERIVLDLGWIFREQPVVDMGIDAHIEYVDEHGPSGKLIAVQIKTGPSHFRENADSYVFRGKLTHLEYWTNHSLPVILVGHLPESGKTFWVYVDPSKVHRTPKSWTISLLKANVFGQQTKETLGALFEGSTAQQRMRKLAIDEPLMRHIQRGGKVSIGLEDWVNKSLGRSNVEVFVCDEDGDERLSREWRVTFVGYGMKELAEAIFPWAMASVDEDFYDLNSIDDGPSFNVNRDEVYPYENVSGEIELYRLKLELNELGEAYLMVADYAAEELDEKSDEEAD